MKNINSAHTAELRSMLAHADFLSVQNYCRSFHPADLADALTLLSESEAWAVLRYAPPPLGSEIFSHFDEDVQAGMATRMPRKDLAALLGDMSPDERADLFKRMNSELQETVLPALAQAEREDIRRLASYEEGTTGAVMTSDYAALSADLTASQAIETLRQAAPDKETIYYTYVVDEQRRLMGFVSLKDLITARRNARVGDIMHKDVIFARAEDDQEASARKIQKYDLLALPVINGGDALVGILTHDDALDIITQETTEDMEKLAAITGAHAAGVYLKTSSWVHFKNRAYWIVGLAALGPDFRNYHS